MKQKDFLQLCNQYQLEEDYSLSAKLVPSVRKFINQAIAVTDAMRGPLLHSALINNEEVAMYDIITPTGWNFSPKDEYGNRGPAEMALVGTHLPSPDLKYVIPGRIIRSFDPCISCATH